MMKCGEENLLKKKNNHKVEAADSTKQKNTDNQNVYSAHTAHAQLKKI